MPRNVINVKVINDTHTTIHETQYTPVPSTHPCTQVHHQLEFSAEDSNITQMLNSSHIKDVASNNESCNSGNYWTNLVMSDLLDPNEVLEEIQESNISNENNSDEHFK